jgi:hypothetical protein
MKNHKQEQEQALKDLKQSFRKKHSQQTRQAARHSWIRFVVALVCIFVIAVLLIVGL